MRRAGLGRPGAPGSRRCSGGPPAAAPDRPRQAIHRPISTTSELAQRYFDQGLALTYGFNHDGAIDAFLEAARLDPNCAICFWGVAYAYGPNINAPMGPEGAAARLRGRSSRRGARLDHATPLEREYIEALSARYVARPAARRPERASTTPIAEAMRGLAARHPDDARRRRRSSPSP